MLILVAPISFEVTGFNPVDDELAVNGHSGVLEALDHGEIGIGEVGVLSNHCYVHFFAKCVKMMRHDFPVRKQGSRMAINAQNITQSLFLEHQGNVVDVRDVMR